MSSSPVPTTHPCSSCGSTRTNIVGSLDRLNLHACPQCNSRSYVGHNRGFRSRVEYEQAVYEARDNPHLEKYNLDKLRRSAILKWGDRQK